MTESSDTNRLVQRINGWSKSSRMVITTLITIILMVVIVIPLDFYILKSDATGSQGILSLVILLLATIIYGVGWHWMLGLDPNKQWQASRASAYFVLAGIIGFIVLIVAIIVLGAAAF
jgi:hypothetical protein